MSGTTHQQTQKSTDVSPAVQSDSLQLQRRPFPHEVESKDDRAATPMPISLDAQSQEKVARARFDPGMISLYPANPVKEEKQEKPIQKKAESLTDDREDDHNPIQRKSESPSNDREDDHNPLQRKLQEPEKEDETHPNKQVQTKLTVGKPGDRYEQEADQVATKVMMMPDPGRNRIQRQADYESEVQPKSLATSITPLVQRQAEEEVQTKAGDRQTNQVNAEFENRLDSNKAGGSPLPGEVRSFMEPRFGVDLSHVRVHIGADAAHLNKNVRAQAFTYRNHIFYAAGKSPGKDELTAHELTHVIQQTGGKALNKTIRRSPDEHESIQPKSLESHATEAEDNKFTPAETSIQRHNISMISPLIQRNAVWDGLKSFGSGVVDLTTGDLEGAKRKLLDPVADFASGMPGYPLLTVVLGKDPIKDQPVERNATNLVRGVLSLAPGGDALFQNLQQSGALQKAFDWFDQQIRLLNLTWDGIKALFRRAIDSLSPGDILHPIDTVSRLANIFQDPINRIIRFAVNVGQKVMEFVFEGAMALAGKGGATRVMGILKKVGGLFMTIVKDPVGFVGNLVRSVKGGFEGFSAHIMTHLKTGLMSWLFGTLSGSGLQMPPALNLKGMLSIALQVVGATYHNLRKKLVRRIGEKRVSQVEKSFALLRSIAAGGLIAAWQQISQSVGDVKEMVVREVRSWVITTIIRQAVIKLVSMFNPAGAVVQAVIAIYDTVMFFIEQWQQIVELANAVFNSINSIAAGNIGAAIKFVEQSMARSLPVIIGFMARLLGLGGISNKIRNVIKRMQKPIDKAMSRIIDTVIKFSRKLLNKPKNRNNKQRNKDKKGAKIPDGRISETINFNAPDEKHRLWIELKGGKPTVMVASSPDQATNKLKEITNKLHKLPVEEQARTAALIRKGFELLNQSTRDIDHILNSVSQLEDPKQTKKNVEQRVKRVDEPLRLAHIFQELFELVYNAENRNNTECCNAREAARYYHTQLQEAMGGDRDNQGVFVNGQLVHSLPSTLTAVVQEDTGETHFGMSARSRHDENAYRFNKMRKIPTLKRALLRARSRQEPWPRTNCGEDEAFIKAIGAGYDLRKLKSAAIKGDRSQEQDRDPCRNCSTMYPPSVFQ